MTNHRVCGRTIVLGMGLITSLAGVGLTPAGIAGARAESTLEKIKDQGSIRLGFANENPFSYTTAKGELAGVDVDILRHILADMGVQEIEGGLTTFGDLLPGLQEGRFDLVASAIYIKPERRAVAAFGEPLYIQGDGIVVVAGNPKNIHGYADVAADPTIKLGYPTGGTGPSDNAKAMGVSEGQLIDFPDTATGFAAIKEGRVDGYATVGMNIEMALREMKDPELERADPFEQPVVDGKVRYGITSFAVRLDDQDLLDALNQRLLAFRGTPEYLTILQKHGMTAAELPPADMTTAEICAG
jgi:polar amino acid transport system substrate-binding protein